MKLKILLSTLIFLVLAGLTTSQLSTPVSATHNSPLTSPVTSALKKLSGIVYFLNNFHFAPAEGATVTAKNKTTNIEYEVTTGSDGAYTLMVPAGKYSVEVEGTGSSNGYRFVPNLKNLPLLVDLKLNFYGLPH